MIRRLASPTKGHQPRRRESSVTFSETFSEGCGLDDALFSTRRAAAAQEDTKCLHQLFTFQ